MQVMNHRVPRHYSSESEVDFDDDDGDEQDQFDLDEDEQSSVSRRAKAMSCLSCKEDYSSRDAGTCRECYEEAGETEEELKRQIDDLKSKVNFLRLLSVGSGYGSRPTSTMAFSDVVLVAADVDGSSPPIPAHRAVLISRSPVFRAMLENEMKESLSGTIKIDDVSYVSLCSFVNYLYTAEACLDENMAFDLLVLAEKYQVKHLKSYCEKYLMSKLNWENSLPYYAFAHQHGARTLLDASLSLIVDNMDKLTKRDEYNELVDKDPRIVVEIYEAYLSRQVNTASKESVANKS